MAALLTDTRALFFAPAAEHAAYAAPYSAAENAWFVALPVHDAGVVLPQIAALNNTSCAPHSSVVTDCAGLATHLGPPWHNDQLGDACDIRTSAARVATQRDAACLEGGFVCATFPSGLRIHNNASALLRFADSQRLLVRLVHLAHSAGVYLVHTHCLLLDARPPLPATGAVALRNTCVLRGLRAPRYASMREAGGHCVWYCTTGRLRRPWNSDPPASAGLTGLAAAAGNTPNYSAHALNDTARVCVLVPEDFVAVEFFVTVELVQSSVDPRLLQPALLYWLDAVSRLTEQHMQTRSGIAGFMTVLSAPGSVYHTHDLHALVPDIVRARRVVYESIVLDSAWRVGRAGQDAARRAGQDAARRAGSAGTADLTVQGLHVMPASSLGDAAAVLFSEQALVAGLAQAGKLPGVQEAWLQTSTRLHRRRHASADAPPEVLFSSSDASALALMLVVTAAGVYVCMHTEDKRPKHEHF
jgi:hypothetical protein